MFMQHSNRIRQNPNPYSFIRFVNLFILKYIINMQRKALLLLGLLLAVAGLFAQEIPPKASEVWEPVPPVVTPGQGTTAPSDAIILFDGKSAGEWEMVNDGSPLKWEVADGAMTVKPKTGAIRTKRSFGDFQLHIEWRAPSKIEGEGQGRGNSGIFLQNRYELQVLDSYNNVTYSNGQAGSIYKQYMPLVNASRPPGEWQTYDVIYTAPRFNEDGIRTSPARVTVLHNGVLIQNNVALLGTTEYNRLPRNEAHGKAPLMLQDHSNPVSFRNIWVRELD